MRARQYRDRLVRRVGILNTAIHGLLFAIGISYWSVQIAEGAHFRELADNNRLRKLSLEAPRGRIFDRRGNVLAENVPSYTLMLDRSLARDVDSSLDFAAGVLGTPRAELAERLEEARGTSRFKPLRLATDLSLRQVAHLAVEHLEHPELDVAVEYRRLYRHAYQTAHVLGYLAEATEQDLAASADYRLGDQVGRKGIERLWEPTLRGTRGEQVVVVDSRGRLVEELDRQPSTPGQDLSLTLDLPLQQEAVRLLDGKTGAIVALDPRQGEILAMVSSPSFDPNLFARGLSSDEWQALNQDPHHPFQNRTLQNAYAPGSVFKIVMALAGLEEGLITAKEPRVYCSGSIQLYDRRWRCWNSGGHGWVDLETSLRASCDVYYYLLGQRLGIDTIAHYAEAFGFGSHTDVDLGGEKRGSVPSSEWSRKARGTPWYPGETISVAIGQGPILVTPLQVAVMMAEVATGRVVRPRLVSDPDPRPGEPLPFSEEHLDLVRRALVDVVEHPAGTGRSARVAGLVIAGKTGTVQVVSQDTWTRNEELPPEQRDHAWFASYAPADDPRLVVVVFVEHGGAGSRAAAPLAKALYEAFFRTELANHRAAG